MPARDIPQLQSAAARLAISRVRERAARQRTSGSGEDDAERSGAAPTAPEQPVPGGIPQRPTDDQKAGTAEWRRLALDLEPLAHKVQGYAEATRLLVDNVEVSRNTLVRIAYDAEDAADELLATLLEGLRSIR